MSAEGLVKELVLLNGGIAARIQCDPASIPKPGQYLLAYAEDANHPLAEPVFSARPFADGFLAAPPLPTSWILGTSLHLRGPLGNGFILPGAARRVALVVFGPQQMGAADSPARVLSLLDLALEQEASLILVCQTLPDDLPLHVEVQPLSALLDACDWADYIAIEARREYLPELRKTLGKRSQLMAGKKAQILICAPMPCGILAECGVCAVESRRGLLLACRDGPVFDLKDFLG